VSAHQHRTHRGIRVETIQQTIDNGHLDIQSR
jgi:hypothetical protein